MELRVGGKYKLTKKLGSGSFGEVYLGTNVITNEKVAIKLEHLSTKFPQLVYEAKLYKMFKDGGGIPKIQWYGLEGDYNVMVMDLLGPSLEHLYKHHEKQLSLKSVLIAADQILSRLEFIHNMGFLHRDIKPENFLIGGAKKTRTLYVIDFGLTKRYTNPKNGKHIKYQTGKPLSGTIRYISVNTHNGIEQSRRDDLESAGYVFMYLLRGQLPWQKIKAKYKKEKYEKIRQCKIDTLKGELCEGYPEEFQLYFDYVMSLDFEDEPNYGYLKKLFRDLFMRMGYEFDKDYDWINNK